MEFHGHKQIFDEVATLATGGMSDVVIATDRASGQQVAVKTPRAGLDPNIAALFLREAEAASKVLGAHVVAIIDWGDTPPFIAFEYMPGGTLADKIKRQAAHWTETELIALFHELVDGMETINAQIVHRDLKPENVFADADGTLKIGDFGIAKYVGEITRTKTFKGWGTPAYMAPETFRSDSIDWRADQYSLGTIFYELATLERPFVGTFDELEDAHLYKRAPRITLKVPGLSERLASVVAKMLEKQPEKRFVSWRALIDEFDAVSSATPAAVGTSGGLVRSAASAVEAVRSQQLEAQRQAEARLKRVLDRIAIIRYWAEELFGSIRERCDTLNASLGENLFLCSTVAPTTDRAIDAEHHECQVTFLKASFELSIRALPIDNEEIVAWGIIDLRTNRRLWLANLLLLSDPPPYGAWQQVDMKLSSYARMNGQTRPDGANGGGYRVEGGDALVLALNLPGLLYQRQLKDHISDVDYIEKPFDFDSVIDELFTYLSEDGHLDPLPPPEPRRDQGGLRFPRV